MDPFHKLDHLTKNQAIHWDWIKYLEAERKILMARIDDLEGVVADIVNDYATREQEKQALEDRIGAAADKLRDAHATLTAQPAPVAAPEAPQADPDTAPAQ
jgi:23S rRNA G2069 N7-methylase RlmK/C1962 C5-methylase RlmI